MRNGRPASHGDRARSFIVNPGFRLGTGAGLAARAMLNDFVRFAFGMPAALQALGWTQPTKEKKDMKLTNAVILALATVLMATAAHAASVQDVEAPRGQEVQAPRNQDVQAPRDRNEDIQAPRGHEVPSPRA